MEILNGHPISLTVTTAAFFFNQIEVKMEVCVFMRSVISWAFSDKENYFSAQSGPLCSRPALQCFQYTKCFRKMQCTFTLTSKGMNRNGIRRSGTLSFNPVTTDISIRNITEGTNSVALKVWCSKTNAANVAIQMLFYLNIVCLFPYCLYSLLFTTLYKLWKVITPEKRQKNAKRLLYIYFGSWQYFCLLLCLFWTFVFLKWHWFCCCSVFGKYFCHCCKIVLVCLKLASFHKLLPNLCLPFGFAAGNMAVKSGKPVIEPMSLKRFIKLQGWAINRWVCHSSRHLSHNVHYLIGCWFYTLGHKRNFAWQKHFPCTKKYKQHNYFQKSLRYVYFWFYFGFVLVFIWLCKTSNLKLQ